MTLIQSNSDQSDPHFSPSDLAPMSFEDVGGVILWISLVLTFALILGAAILAKWILGIV